MTDNNYLCHQLPVAAALFDYLHDHNFADAKLRQCNDIFCFHFRASKGDLLGKKRSELGDLHLHLNDLQKSKLINKERIIIRHKLTYKPVKGLEVINSLRLIENQSERHLLSCYLLIKILVTTA